MSGALDPVDVRVVESHAAFVALAAELNALVAAMPTQSVFLRHEWYCAAWAWRQQDSELHVLVARDKERALGVLPLVRRLSKTGCILTLLTVPDTQASDMICAPENAERVAEAFAAWLAKSADWRMLDLDFLSPAGPAARALLPALARAGLRSAERVRDRNLFVVLNDGWNAYARTRSRRFKKSRNLAANRARKGGDISIEWLQPGENDRDGYVRILDDMLCVSSKSWKVVTGNALDSPGPHSFIRALSAAAFDRQWLSVWLLRVDGRAVAMEYQLIYNGKVHALRADFDAAYDRWSPGSHLSHHLLERLFERGFSRYYMGPGHNAYKFRWTDEGEPLRRVMFYNRTLRGLVAWMRDEIARPVLRRARDSVVKRDGALARAVVRASRADADPRFPSAPTKSRVR